MPFVRVPDQLPSPQTYLRAGFARPNQPVNYGEAGQHQAAREATSSPQETQAVSLTTVDDDNTPQSMVWNRSQRYLARPSPRRWDQSYRAEVIGRAPSGVLQFQLIEASPTSRRYQPAPFDSDAGRVVTFDRSVYIAGIDPTLFEPDDLMFISMALYIEAAVTHSEGPGDQLATSFDHWNLTEPVPVDPYIVRIYQELASASTKPLRRTTPDPVDRVDLLCAASAILYEAPLYTTTPSLYSGLRNGLKVVKYGPRRTT